MNRLKPSWMGTLTAVLALLYLYAGISSRGADMAAGLIGAALILLALPGLGLSRWIRKALLLAGALPLAVMTWWSLVTPIVAVLVIVIGSWRWGRTQAHHLRCTMMGWTSLLESPACREVTDDAMAPGMAREVRRGLASEEW